MASVNKVILIGNLGRDPDVRHTQGGEPVCNFSIATSEKWTGKDGQAQERTEWHNITVWGKLAELCGQYLAKGRSVYVEGKIQTREYQDKEGVTRKAVDIIANSVTFLGGRGEGDSAGGGEGGQQGGGRGGAAGGGGGGGWGGGGGGGGGGQRGGQQGGGGGQRTSGGGNGGNWGQGGGQRGGGGNQGGGWGGGNGNSAPPDDDPIPF